MMLLLIMMMSLTKVWTEHNVGKNVVFSTG